MYASGPFPLFPAGAFASGAMPQGVVPGGAWPAASYGCAHARALPDSICDMLPPCDSYGCSESAQYVAFSSTVVVKLELDMGWTLHQRCVQVT